MQAQDDAEAGKRAAAAAAAALVKDGMVLGLGTGSTIRFLIESLAERIRREQLRLTAVATSLETEARARAAGIAEAELAPGRQLELAIDGADEVEQGSLRLIKGLGGALLREKIVASSSRNFIVIADESKLVAKLGARAPVPVEVVRFAHAATAGRLERLGGHAVLRLKAGQPFITDNGNFIYDLYGLAPIADPEALECDLAQIPGVVESGLFTLPVRRAFIGSVYGTIRALEPLRSKPPGA